MHMSSSHRNDVPDTLLPPRHQHIKELCALELCAKVIEGKIISGTFCNAVVFIFKNIKKNIFYSVHKCLPVAKFSIIQKCLTSVNLIMLHTLNHTVNPLDKHCYWTYYPLKFHVAGQHS